MSRYIYIMLFLFVLSSEGQGQIYSEFQDYLTSGQKFVVSQSPLLSYKTLWVTTELWRVVFENNDLISEGEIMKAEEVFSNYLVVFTFKVSFENDAPKYHEVDAEQLWLEMEEQVFQPMKEEEIEPEALELINSIHDLFARQMGAMGSHFKPTFFDVSSMPEKFKADTNGAFDIYLDSVKVTYELPLAPYSQTKLCPAGNVTYTSKYNFCPIHGIELVQAPPKPKSKKKLMHWDYLDQAKAAFKEEKYEQSLDLVKNAFDSEAPYIKGPAFAMAGDNALRLQKYEEAEEYYLKAEKVAYFDADFSKRLNWTIGEFYSFFNPLKSIEYYKKILLIDEDHDETNVNIGRTYSQILRHEKAVEYLSKAIENDTKYPAVARHYRGASYINLGIYDKGYEDLQLALQLDSKNPYTHEMMSFYYLEINRESKRCASLKKAMDLDITNYGPEMDREAFRNTYEQSCK